MTTQATEAETRMLQPAPSAKVAGPSAGEFFGAFVREGQVLLQQTGRDRVQLMRLLLLRLQVEVLITSHEVDQLGNADPKMEIPVKTIS